MLQTQSVASVAAVASGRFWALWAVAFLGFPIGGGLAYVLVGPITTPVQAALAGAITGAILGLVQWFVLRLRLPVPIWWEGSSATRTRS